VNVGAVMFKLLVNGSSIWDRKGYMNLRWHNRHIVWLTVVMFAFTVVCLESINGRLLVGYCFHTVREKGLGLGLHSCFVWLRTLHGGADFIDMEQTLPSKVMIEGQQRRLTRPHLSGESV
jgi:hypothetical protein